MAVNSCWTISSHLMLVCCKHLSCHVFFCFHFTFILFVSEFFWNLHLNNARWTVRRVPAWKDKFSNSLFCTDKFILLNLLIRQLNKFTQMLLSSLSFSSWNSLVLFATSSSNQILWNDVVQLWAAWDVTWNVLFFYPILQSIK